MPVLAVETADLFEVVWVGAAAGLGITVLFSLVLLNYARFAEARRSGRAAVATLNGVLAAVAFIVFAAGVILGVQTMLAK